MKANKRVQSEDIPVYGDAPDTREADDLIRRAFSLLERRLKKPGKAFVNPKVTQSYLTLKLATEEREHFGVLFLNNRHALLADEILFSGTIDGSSVYPREVVKAAFKHNAAAVILYHNHPSGSLEPSRADLLITDRLKQALELVEIRLLDHVIIGGTKAYSFSENSRLI